MQFVTNNNPQVNNQFTNYQQPSCAPQLQPVQFGNNGYNTNYNPYTCGGYYSGYNGYYDPYYAEEMKKRQEAQERERQRQQIDIMKVLSRTADPNISEESLNTMYSEETMFSKPTQEDIEQNNLMQMHLQSMQNPNMINNSLNRVLCEQEKIYEYRQQLVPKSCNLFELGEASINLVIEREKQEARQRQIESYSRMYNRSAFRQTINAYEGNNNYFSDMYDNNSPLSTLSSIPLDDVEQEIPPYKMSKETEARAEYMKRLQDAIYERNKANGL